MLDGHSNERGVIMEGLSNYAHISMIIGLFILIACAIGIMIYIIFSGAVEFKEEIVFRPLQQKGGEHANDSTD